MKQRFRIQDPQDPRSQGSQDRTNIKDPRSEGSQQNECSTYEIHGIPQQNAKSHGPQDLTAKIINHEMQIA